MDFNGLRLLQRLAAVPLRFTASPLRFTASPRRLSTYVLARYTPTNWFGGAGYSDSSTRGPLRTHVWTVRSNDGRSRVTIYRRPPLGFVVVQGGGLIQGTWGRSASLVLLGCHGAIQGSYLNFRGCLSLDAGPWSKSFLYAHRLSGRYFRSSLLSWVLPKPPSSTPRRSLPTFALPLRSCCCALRAHFPAAVPLDRAFG